MSEMDQARTENKAVAPKSAFQSAAGEQGRQFASQCDPLLRNCGYQVGSRILITAVGIEIDKEAVSPNGRTIWFEYKGSVQGARPGLMRTDTLKKAIANGALLASLPDHPPFVVLTSHLPEGGAGLAMLNTAKSLWQNPDGVKPNSGHLHVIVDSGCVPAGQVIPADASHLHYGKAQTEAEVPLAPGKHNLCIQVADAAHVATDVTKTISVTVT